MFEIQQEDPFKNFDFVAKTPLNNNQIQLNYKKNLDFSGLRAEPISPSVIFNFNNQKNLKFDRAKSPIKTVIITKEQPKADAKPF